MDTITTQLLSLLPFIGLGLLLTFAYVADGRHNGEGAPPDDLDTPDNAIDPLPIDPLPIVAEQLESAGIHESGPATSGSRTNEDPQGQGEPVLGWIVIALLAMADLAAGVIGSLTAVSGAMLLMAPELVGDISPPPGLSEESMPEGSIEAIADSFVTVLMPLGMITALLGFTGLLLLIPSVRRMLVRIVPIDPRRLTHTVALHYALMLVLFSAAVAYAIPIIATNPEGRELIEQATERAGLLGIWVQNLGFALLGLLGVGLFVARGPGATLRRLGVTPWINVRWWAGATIIALAAAWGVDAMWSIVSPESLNEVNKLSELLFDPIIAYGVAGALTIGLAAGIGEEIIFRGAMQPRFGLGLTALLFTAIHTQYTVSLALVQILVVALLLGYARKYSNTTTTIAIHATYNFALAMTAVLSA